jgi:uncharacterized membrane protein YfcA
VVTPSGASLGDRCEQEIRAHREHRRYPDAGDQPAARPVPTLLLGLVLGVLVALTSVGAGAIGVVALTALYHSLSARRLVGTDIVHAIPLTFLAGMSHFSMGNVDMPILGVLLIGSVPGIALGSRITGYVPDWLLRIALAIVLMWAAYSLVFVTKH